MPLWRDGKYLESSKYSSRDPTPLGFLNLPAVAPVGACGPLSRASSKSPARLSHRAHPRQSGSCCNFRRIDVDLQDDWWVFSDGIASYRCLLVRLQPTKAQGLLLVRFLRHTGVPFAPTTQAKRRRFAIAPLPLILVATGRSATCLQPGARHARRTILPARRKMTGARPQAAYELTFRWHRASGSR